MFNGGVAGLTFWSPNVNILRDPRWGRGQETPGEDPYLAAEYASRYVKGLQGYTGGNRLKIAACCKHFTAYDLDEWNGIDRYHFNAKVSKQDLEDTYNVPFKSCVVDGNVASVMCSYNQVNGKPTCANEDFLKGTIRNQWGLDGYIVSDCDSVVELYQRQHYTATAEEAAAVTIKAGLDLNCGMFLAAHTEKAINKSLLEEDDVNSALRNTLSVQMRLGLFDGNHLTHPYRTLSAQDVCTPIHRQLALDAARESIVLLQNRDGTLPLSAAAHHTVAVVGPNSNATVTMIGNYAGTPCSYISPLEGISRYVKTIHEWGCEFVSCEEKKGFDAAVDAAKGSDAAVVILGLDQSIEAEKIDRTTLLLPGNQQELVTRVAAASNGPTILVLMSGGPIDVTFAKNNRRIGAIVWAGYPGQAGGAAIADILFGQTNPSGKLPMTWYPETYLSNVPMTDMSMRAEPSRGYPGRTYRFYNGPVVFPFAYGMTYTAFSHSIVQAPPKASVPVPFRNFSAGNSVLLSHAKCDATSYFILVDVTNTGTNEGKETLLVYSRPPEGHAPPNHKSLVHFTKVHLSAGESKRVSIQLNLCKHLSVVDTSGARAVPLGSHSIHVGEVIAHRITVDCVFHQTES